MNLIKTMIIVLLSAKLAAAGGWALQKSCDNYRAYTKGISKKQYMVEAKFDLCIDSVLTFLTGFENFPKYYDNIKTIKIIDRTDSVVYHYSVLKTPWPLNDRDIVTKIRISKMKNNRIVINSNSAAGKIPVNNDFVRIEDFEEELELISRGIDSTDLKITGSIGIKEKIPSWLENKLILSGPVKTVEILNGISKGERK
jgi:hypothetical protein